MDSNECLNFYLKEAYEEFKHILLALVYGEEDKNSPVASEVRGYFLGIEIKNSINVHLAAIRCPSGLLSFFWGVI